MDFLRVAIGRVDESFYYSASVICDVYCQRIQCDFIRRRIKKSDRQVIARTLLHCKMLNFIKNLINLNAALASKARSLMAYDEAMVFYRAKDFKQALPLMTEASELGNAQAMSILGTMYLMGEGVKEEGLQAIVWLQRSIDAGFVDATSVLGMAYATGKAGVKIDIPKARKMLACSAENGDKQSARMLSMMDRGDGMFKHLKKNRVQRIPVR